MTVLVLFVAVVLGAVVQATLPVLSAAGGVQAPVMVGIVIYYALTRDRAAMLTAAIVAGLIEDAMGLMPLGYSSFCYVLVGLAAQRFRETVLVRQWTTHVLFGALANGLVALALSLMLGLIRVSEIGVAWVLAKIAVAIVAGAIIVPLVFRFVAFLDRMVGNVEAEET
ncbi:MAG: rod shape-determining protein MreD [bacterium]